MKNWKQYVVIGFLLILCLVFLLIACDNNKNNDSILCNCSIKEHLSIDEICCNGEDCNCSELIGIIESININIRKQEGITVDQMNIAIITINEAYTELVGTEQDNFIVKIMEIHIIKNGNNVELIDNILYVKYNATKGNIKTYLIINEIV